MRMLEKSLVLLLSTAIVGSFAVSSAVRAEDASAQSAASVKKPKPVKAKADAAGAAAPARDATAPAAAPAATASDAGNAPSLGLNEIVVTGNSAKTEKFKASYAISTQNKQDLQDKQPRSVVDVFKSLPGVTVENSGGEGGGENVVIRGLPFAGFRLLDVQEDGLPLFHSNYERELNADELFRVDLNTTRAEIVRGGTAPIYSDNASGGAINFITNHGTETQQNAIKLSTSSYGTLRSDFASSGPITPNLLYSVSGFFRRDDGMRYPGFANADLGGQGKVGMTYLLDAGKVWADFKMLNDRNIFYTSIPLTSPVTGASLKGLINQNFGTLDSNSFRYANILTLNGVGGLTTLNRDLADGIHPQTRTFSFGGDYDLGDGWKIQDKGRIVSGSVGFDALLNGSPTDAAAFLATNMSAAQKAFAGTKSLRYTYAGTNNVFDPSSTAGLVMANNWMTVRTNYDNFVNDFSATKTIETPNFGTHDITGGFALSIYRLDQAQLGNTILTNTKNHPDALDVQALDANGNVTGLVTQNGFTTYGTGDLIGNARGVTPSIYGAENWHITKNWQIDIGFRHEMEFDQGNRGVLGTVTVPGGSLAAQSVTGLTGYVPYKKTLVGTSATIGSSYQWTDTLNTWARYTSTYSFPRISDQWGGTIVNGVAGYLPNGQPIPITPIQQAEIGAKMLLPNMQLALIGFYSHFHNLNSSTYVANSTTGILSNQPLLIDTTTTGIEFEAAWKISKEFNLRGAATLQDPRIVGATSFSALYTADSLKNNMIPRVPNYQFSIEPSYNFEINDMQGSIFSTVYIEGRRFQDFTNKSVLPAFATLDIGSRLKVTKNIDLELLMTNVTNSTGLTEGNARAPASNVITVSDATVGRPIFGRAVMASATIHW
jgi:iron complex outermembrane receptor protein